MSNQPANPYGAHEPNRRELWEMLVARDIGAFVAGRWDEVVDDFEAESFTAVHAGFHSDPDHWSLGFPTLEDYRTSWLAAGEQFGRDFDDPASVLFDATRLDQIEITGDAALAHKTFDDVAVTRSGARIPIRWKTLYQCVRRAGRWRIRGFVGYLPLEGTSTPATDAGPSIDAPATSRAAVGAYSPVLTVRPARLVVISGQAALGADGALTATDVAGQTTETLANCARQLAAAGAGLADVFKVNAFLKDIADWGVFNEVYASVMPAGRLPVRTAVGAALAPGLLVEIEMWAARR